MPLLRRFLPLLALLMGGVVTVQALDLVACADEIACAGVHSETGHGAHGEETSPDCLCHLAFTSAEPQQITAFSGPGYENPVLRGLDRRDDGARPRLDRPPRG